VPEGVQDGGDFQYGGGLYFATVGLSFDPETGEGDGSRLYAYDATADEWSSEAPTTVNDQPVCNEALAYDPLANQLYATIVNVLNADAGGDPSLLSKLAIYVPASNVWVGATSDAPDVWNPGTEAEYLDGCIYVWRGGFNGANVDGSDSYLDVYHTASDSWTVTPSLRDSGIIPGFRTGGFDVWGVSLTSDPVHHLLFVTGAESNHQLYVFDTVAQSWKAGPSAPYDGGWGSSLEYVPASGRLYRIDGRNSSNTPQGSAVLLHFLISSSWQPPDSILLNWAAVGGRSYQIQFTTNLNQPNWVNLGGAGTATNLTGTLNDSVSTDPQRFYRAVLAP
jgi:hypothetical protein